MKLSLIKASLRLLAAVAIPLAAASCAYLPFQLEAPASPLVGSWTTQDHNQVTFRPDAVIVTPDKGQATTMGPSDCNGVYKLQYGVMDTGALEKSFPSQPDFAGKLRQLLVKPEYPVADVTCDQGGTTYLMLDERQMLAVYRDSGVGGTEAFSRL